MANVEADLVAVHYDSPAGRLGPAMFGGHLHWGYWDAATAGVSFATAADRLAQIMIDKTEIKADQKFIDLGCGVGQPALRLAKAKDCFVDGVTISKFQQESATGRAKAEKMQDRLRFFHGNALALPFEDNTYDGGWFFESIFHMGHRAALSEAGRVLKSGSTLLLTDLPTLPGTTDKFRGFAREHIHSSFVTKEDYPALMSEAGFKLVAMDDITANVMPWLVLKLKEAIEEHRSAITEVITDDVEKTIDNWLYLFEYMSEQLGYMVVTAQKL
jgi:cyclopropane fatty-acyl-phospholipid synthase-like methyltransferase